MGTMRDLVAKEKDGAELSKRVSEVKRWFQEHPLAKERFVLVDAYAVSCKEWTVFADTGGKHGVSSFSQVMRALGTELHQRAPVNPQALLGEHATYGGSAGMELGEWWHHNEEVRDERERARKGAYKGLLTLLVHIGRLRQRGIWLLGACDFLTLCAEHIPDYVVDEMPDVVRRVRRALEDRSLVLPLRDAAFDDEREGVCVLGISVVTDFVAALMLPTMYLSLLGSYPSERPGQLKAVLQKHTRFNVEEVWRPDWELLFDGNVSPTATMALLKNSLSFRKDPALGAAFLGCTGSCFPVRVKDEEMQHMPGLALREMSGELEAALVAAFDRHAGGKTAARLRVDAVTPWETVDVMRRLHADGSGDNGNNNDTRQHTCRTWYNAALVSRGKSCWGYVRFALQAVTVCCAGTGPEAQALADFVRSRVDAAFQQPGGWRDGVSPDGLPRLLPSVSALVEEAADLDAFVASLPQDVLRGADYPDDIFEDAVRQAKSPKKRMFFRSKNPPSPKLEKVVLYDEPAQEGDTLS